MIGMGIDFGTSNCAVATYDGEKLFGMTLDTASLDPEVMPSALYLSRERQATVGQAAVDLYLAENSGRRVELERETLGVLQLTVADTDQTQLPDCDGLTIQSEVHALTDAGLPGRLFRGVKRWLGATTLDSVRVFGAHYRIVALVTPVLAHLASTARAQLPRSRARVYVGRPVHYEGESSSADTRAVARMHEACGYAGLQDARLYPEPVAAALTHVALRRAEGCELLLAFDFGGGTLDLSLIRAHRGAFEVQATHGLGLGGDEINREMYRQLVFPELGCGLHQHIVVDESRIRVEFPFDRFADRLLAWPLAYELHRRELCELIVQGMREGPMERRRLGRLLELIRRNRAYEVFQAIESCKLALSTKTRARIQVEELDLDVSVTRVQLERLLTRALTRIDVALERVLGAAGVRAEAVDRVVRTGGSSRIPAVVRRLEEWFPGRVLEDAPFTSIAAGLAIASFQGTGVPAALDLRA